MNPKISVVIPSYNKVKYIQKTLDSILNQSYKNIELIIQDGGSTDGTSEIIKNYQRRYPKIIKSEIQKDGGQLDAIIKGFKKATGDIYAFINADDIYEVDAFDAVVGSYTEHREALWFAGKGIVIDSEGREIAKPVSWYKSFLLIHSTYYLLLTTNFLMQPSVFLTARAYKKYGPFTGTVDFVTEYDLWLKLAKIQMPTVVNKTLSRFRIEVNTKTKKMSEKLLKEDERILNRYTSDPIVKILHKLHNYARLFLSTFV
jgi:glycosyltransferase involved in cell wall biosynthesis